jgi:GDP-4-dehydro-6-deoxy-D-mannose reductase
MMNVMITGAAGFIGRVLTEYCVQAGCSVLGIDIVAPESGGNGAPFELCDVLDSGRMANLVARFQPDRIFHLAAQSYPTVSLAKPRETMEVNAGGTINLFEAVRGMRAAPFIVVACSSAEYGPVASADLPVREEHPLRPLHPYGVSKVAQDLLAAQYFENYAIPCARIRIFNTTGAGKLGDVCSDLTRRAIEIELGLRSCRLPVGNLVSRRAILDVRDLVRALWLSAERCEPGSVYNVGGDRIYSVRELIDAITGQTETRFEIEQDASLMRACDEPVIAGDTGRFRRCTGWQQEIALTTTLAEMLNWWRNRLQAQMPRRQSDQLDDRALQSGRI